MVNNNREPYFAPKAEVSEACLEYVLLEVSQIDPGFEDDFGEF